MEARRRLLTMALLLLAAACTQKPEAPRNVVLISLDTMRADRMSVYGSERDTTPAVEALAAKGVTFTKAYSAAPWTLPSHAALFTGRYPSSLSAESYTQFFRLAPTLASILSGHGYRTTAVTDGGYLSPVYGAEVGFDKFDKGRVEDAVAFIQEQGDVPFFLFFHTYSAHLPYTDTRYVEGVDGGRLSKLAGRKSKMRHEKELEITCGRAQYSEAEKDFVLALYDGGVAAADEMVDQLIEALREEDVLENTIVIITSDHGEEFWEHTNRGAAHGHTLYDELLRVPLIWYESDLPRPGIRPNEPVSLVDVVPTVLARLRFPPVPGVDGIDLSALLEGRKLEVDRTLVAGGVRHGPKRHGVITPDGKLIVNGDPADQRVDGKRCAVPVAAEREVYLPSDGAESRNSAGEQPELTERLAKQLEEIAQAHATAAEAAPPVPQPDLDPITRKRLEVLGYVVE